MAYKNNQLNSEKNTLHEPDVSSSYSTGPGIAIAVSPGEIKKESYIQKAMTLLGATTAKPFSQVQNNADLINCIRAGLPRKALDILMKFTGITLDEITGIIRTSDRTLRRYAPQQKLNAEQTERLIEIAKLYSRGEEVFGSLDAFKEWMNSTVMALGNKQPKSFLDTSLGIDILMNELGRIEHGVFA